MSILSALTVTMAGPRIVKPQAAVITFKNLRFYITDQPSERRIETFVQELKSFDVTDLVRVDGTDYSTDLLQEAGIHVMDLPYDDGKTPSDAIVDGWFKVLRRHLAEESSGCVAVHCRAGLGRAPVLVAIALIELGMKYEDAVLLIRHKRPGAINAKQLHYLSKFRRHSRLASKTRCIGCFPM